jgi:hypothetical protein
MLALMQIWIRIPNMDPDLERPYQCGLVLSCYLDPDGEELEWRTGKNNKKGRKVTWVLGG